MKNILDRLPWIILVVIAFSIGWLIRPIKEMPYPVVRIKKEKAELPKPKIKWKDKIIYQWKQAHPETVYYYESSILPFKPREGIISMEYKPNKLVFWTKWLAADTTGMGSEIKKYPYPDVYPEFTITQGKDGWRVDSRKDWFRKELYMGLTYPDIAFIRLDFLFNRILISGRATTKKGEVDLGWKI